MLFEVTSFVVPCYGSNRNLKHSREGEWMSLARIRKREDKALGWRFEKDGNRFWKVLVFSVTLKTLLIMLDYWSP